MQTPWRPRCCFASLSAGGFETPSLLSQISVQIFSSDLNDIWLSSLREKHSIQELLVMWCKCQNVQLRLLFPWDYLCMHLHIKYIMYSESEKYVSSQCFVPCSEDVIFFSSSHIIKNVSSWGQDSFEIICIRFLPHVCHFKFPPPASISKETFASL